MNRVAGVLAVTRAFGDYCVRDAGLISVPQVSKRILKQTDKCLIMASDGVWDEVSDQEAVDICQGSKSAKQAAQQIVKTALQKGSRDNISLIVLKLN